MKKQIIAKRFLRKYFNGYDLDSHQLQFLVREKLLYVVVPLVCIDKTLLCPGTTSHYITSLRLPTAMCTPGSLFLLLAQRLVRWSPNYEVREHLKNNFLVNTIIKCVWNKKFILFEFFIKFTLNFLTRSVYFLFIYIKFNTQNSQMSK